MSDELLTGAAWMFQKMEGPMDAMLKENESLRTENAALRELVGEAIQMAEKYMPTDQPLMCIETKWFAKAKETLGPKK
jgi:hypothetical protein